MPHTHNISAETDISIHADTNRDLTAFAVILGVLRLLWLGAGFQFWVRDWSQSMAVKSLNSSHQTTGDQEPVARPWPVTYVEMNFHIETESSEISVYYEEKGYMDGLMEGLERMLRPCSSLSHVYGHFFLGLLCR